MTPGLVSGQEVAYSDAARAGGERWLVLGPGPVIEYEAHGERTNATIAQYAVALERAALLNGARFVPLTDVVTVADLPPKRPGAHATERRKRCLTWH